MITIREDQIFAFETVALQNFEKKMVTHCQLFSSQLCDTVADSNIRLFVQRSIKRAYSYGLTLNGSVSFYIELALMLGCDFDTDPQYIGLSEILEQEMSDEMSKADQLYEWFNQYEQILETESENKYSQAKRILDSFSNYPIKLSSPAFVDNVIQEFKRVSIKKVKYIGDQRLTDLINQARQEAHNHDILSDRGFSVLVTLLYTLGHRCLYDPMYPWLSDMLNNKREMDQESFTQYVESQCMRWIEKMGEMGDV